MFVHFIFELLTNKSFSIEKDCFLLYGVTRVILQQKFVSSAEFLLALILESTYVATLTIYNLYQTKKGSNRAFETI